MNSFEKKILEIHEAFLLEYSRTSIQMSQLYQKVNSYIQHIVVNGIDNKIKLNDHLSNIREVCFLLKKIYKEAEVHSCMLTIENDKNVVVDKISSNDGNNRWPRENEENDNFNEILPFEFYSDMFTFTSMNMLKYYAGYEGVFGVTYIKDAANDLWFLIDKSSVDIIIQSPDFRYKSIPAEGVVFGLLLDDIIVRAVRENYVRETKASFRVLLIDFGEIVEITKEYKMYVLSEYLQTTPGRAMLAHVHNANGNIENKLHKPENFRVKGVKDNVLQVEIIPEINPKTQISNKLVPFHVPATFSDSSDLSMDSSRKHSLTEKQFLNSENEASSSTISKSIPTTSSSSSNEYFSGKIKDSTVSEEQFDDDDEEFTTDNALVAIMGYAPQDEKRICKFYDPKINGCFKGASCKLEHTTILEDGWTKDQAMIKTTIRLQLPIPEVGSNFFGLVSHVTDVENFYMQLIPKKCKNMQDLPAENISLQIRNIFTNLNVFTQPPDIFELVIAKYSDDGWYRAKILQKYEDQRYKVFYVDYGSCFLVTKNQIRKWHDSLDQYPFQALHCRLDNVSKIRGFHREAITYFQSLVLHKGCLATVTSNKPLLNVLLRDENQHDVGQQLIASNYATPKPITEVMEGNIPG